MQVKTIKSDVFVDNTSHELGDVFDIADESIVKRLVNESAVIVIPSALAEPDDDETEADETPATAAAPARPAARPSTARPAAR